MLTVYELRRNNLIFIWFPENQDTKTSVLSGKKILQQQTAVLWFFNIHKKMVVSLVVILLKIYCLFPDLIILLHFKICLRMFTNGK